MWRRCQAADTVTVQQLQRLRELRLGSRARQRHMLLYRQIDPSGTWTVPNEMVRQEIQDIVVNSNPNPNPNPNLTLTLTLIQDIVAEHEAKSRPARRSSRRSRTS